MFNHSILTVPTVMCSVNWLKMHKLFLKYNCTKLNYCISNFCLMFFLLSSNCTYLCIVFFHFVYISTYSKVFHHFDFGLLYKQINVLTIPCTSVHHLISLTNPKLTQNQAITSTSSCIASVTYNWIRTPTKKWKDIIRL